MPEVEALLKIIHNQDKSYKLEQVTLISRFLLEGTEAMEKLAILMQQNILTW